MFILFFLKKEDARGERGLEGIWVSKLVCMRLEEQALLGKLKWERWKGMTDEGENIWVRINVSYKTVRIPLLLRRTSPLPSAKTKKPRPQCDMGRSLLSSTVIFHFYF